MKKAIFNAALAVLLGASMTALATDECVLPVNNTAWDVGAFDNNGIVSAPHHVPWVFKRDGTVSAAGYWSMTWQRAACDKVHVVGFDTFDVYFVTSTRLIAVKGDILYRFGKKR